MDETKSAKRSNLVAATAEGLRVRSFEVEPGDLLGSLTDLAKALGVGIVTLQQAARVVEHEGLLTVRRGPGGGYYAARPDAAALERALSAFLRTHPATFREALNITSLLFTELVEAAAKCSDQALRTNLASLAVRVDEGIEFDQATFEHDFQHLLFRMVDWPLFELLTEVTLRFSVGVKPHAERERPSVTEEWKAGRRRIIAAILAGDPALARFEADRSNRGPMLRRLH